MLKCFGHIAFFLGVAVSLNFSAYTDVYAQGISVEAKSELDFINKDTNLRNNEKLKAIFEKEGDLIICGDTTQVCDKKNQICLRCTVTFENNFAGFKVLKYGTERYDYGYCAPVDKVDLNNLDASWPSCKPGKTVNLNLLGTTNTIRELKIEEHGFVKDRFIKALGITFYRPKEEFVGANGKKYMIYSNNSGPVMAYAEDDFRGCEVLPVKIYNMQRCFFCPLSRILFKTVNRVTKFSFVTLIIIVYAVWLAIISLKQVFPFTKKDASDYFERIVKQSFKLMLAYFILMNSSFFFQNFVSPILVSGLKMGEAIRPVDIKLVPGKDVDMPSEPMMEKGYYNVEVINGNTLYTEIESYLSSIQAQMSYIQAVGTSLFCAGLKQVIPDLSDFKEDLKRSIRLLVLGAMLTFIGLLFSIVFAFYFLDAIMQLGLLGMMMPMMIAGWPFAITKHFAEKGLGLLLNTFFIFFFTGFVISVNVVLIDQSLTYSAERNTESNAEFINEAHGGLNAIAQALHEQNEIKLGEATNIGGTGFLLILFSSIFGFIFVKEVTPLAGKLSDGSFVKGMSSKMATLVASTGKGMADKATAPARKYIGDKWDQAGGVAGIVSGAIGSVANKGSDIASAMGAKGVARTMANIGRGAGKAKKIFADVKTKVSSDREKANKQNRKTEDDDEENLDD